MYERSKEQTDLLLSVIRAIVYGSGRQCSCPKCERKGTLRLTKSGSFGCYCISFIHKEEPKTRCRLTNVSFRELFPNDLPAVQLIHRILQRLRNSPEAVREIEEAIRSHQPIDVNKLVEQSEKVNELKRFLKDEKRRVRNSKPWTVNDREEVREYDEMRRNAAMYEG